MSDVLIRGVSDDVLAVLKRRAEENRRSLQQELLTIIEAAARSPDRWQAVEIADHIRQRLAAGGRSLSDSTELIREDRDR
jgi:plasmid stability protein